MEDWANAEWIVVGRWHHLALWANLLDERLAEGVSVPTRHMGRPNETHGPRVQTRIRTVSMSTSVR